MNEITVDQPVVVSDDDAQPLSFNRYIAILAIVGATMGVVGVGLAIYLWSPIADLSIPGLDLTRHLTHPSGEATLYSWFSVLVLASIAVGFTVIGLVTWRAERRPWPYLVLAATALLLSADEAALLHEKMGIVASILGLNVSWTYNWLLVAVPLAAVCGLMLIWIARSINPLLRKRLIIAGALFLFGAVGMEALGGTLENEAFDLAEGTRFVLFHLSILVEESLELAGALVALWAALAHLDVRRGPAGLVVTVRD